MKLYEAVAQTIGERIEQELYRVGDRLPSIRELCQEFQISVSTAQEAYRRLEEAGTVEAGVKRVGMIAAGLLAELLE